MLLPRKGRFGIIDYEKAFPLARDIFDARGIDREQGCMVLVRPDQFVSHVLRLDDHDGLSSFFDGILIDAKTGSELELRESRTPTSAA